MSCKKLYSYTCWKKICRQVLSWICIQNSVMTFKLSSVCNEEFKMSTEILYNELFLINMKHETTFHQCFLAYNKETGVII